ncbi:hypothetical protein [Polaribacter atrinae]|uniref:DUF5723 domain-containing protein n=1 Tax=Polaribacter atrinae TaxID=1333662 RepID=A0A176T9U7_9FLAO|nr:hypothetical protein [Polaribacter atrinae]OAD44674.1 hypothetical protein LPB303_10960 [Polaribacter atrinae]
MQKIILLLIVLTSSHVLFSQTENIPERITQKGFAKIDFLSIKMPPPEDIGSTFNEPNMGFTGIHYNLFLNKSFYTGVGLYGSIAGIRGGFFTLGVNAGLKKYLSEKLYIDTGFHFGGGGGAGAADGGGAFILPHVNLGYQFKNFSLNGGWSYVNFFDGGRIKGHQLNIALEIPLDFEYASYKSAENEMELQNFENTNWDTKPKRNSLMVHFNNLKVLSESKSNNHIKGKTIKLAGFEFTSYLNDNWFTFLKVDGAYDGIRAGYMDVLLGGGYHLSMNKNRTNILAKLGFGAGGGGGVDSKGGFLFYPDLSIEQQLFKDIYVSVNKGYLLTPNKDFYTSTFGAGIKYYIERNGIKTDNTSFKKGKFKGFEVIVKQDMYLNAKRMETPTEHMHQISLQINLDLNKNLYVTAQTSFANFGNAGAYGEGLVGLGIKSNPLFNNSTSLFTQLIGGAAGGGNISTGQGLIIKPSLGVDYELSKTLNLRAAAGYVKAKGGDLSSPFINLGLKYNISFLKLQ